MFRNKPPKTSSNSSNASRTRVLGGAASANQTGTNPRLTKQKNAIGFMSKAMLKSKLQHLSDKDIPNEGIRVKDSNNDAYRAVFWQGSKGPAILIEQLKNSAVFDSEELLGERGNLPAEIYVKADDEQNRDALVAEMTATLNDQIPDTMHYERDDLDHLDNPDTRVVKLRLVEKLPVLEDQTNSADNSQRAAVTAVTQQASASSSSSAAASSPPAPPSPRPLQPNTTVILSRAFMSSVGKVRDKQEAARFNKIVSALDTYNQEVEQIKISLARGANEPELSDQEFNRANARIQAHKEALEVALDEYLLENQSLGAKTSARLANQPVRAVEALKKQLDDANKNGVNEELQLLRLNRLLKKYKPLQDHQIDQTRQGEVLGVGAQGEVRSRFYDTHDRPGFPALFEAGIKFDHTEANDEAVAAGIPQNKPEEAKRAVASYQASRLLGLNVVPLTDFVLGENPKNRRIELGQAMQRVHGADGQRAVRETEYTPDQVAAMSLLDDNFQNPPQTEVDKVAKRAWKLINKPVSVALSNPVIQKELADLQILDCVIGHADRHPGNWRFEGAGPDQITSVKGIDNDDTFGKDWKPRNDQPRQFERSSKTPGVPPIIDIETAINILKVTSLESLKDKLSPEEYHAALTRLGEVQETIRDRIKQGHLAIMPGALVADADLDFLATQAGLENTRGLVDLPQWGSAAIYNAHRPPPKLNKDDPDPQTNSYLGDMILLSSELGTAEPEFT